MTSYTGYMQMGATPVAGARGMYACASGRSTGFATAAATAAAASHVSWLAGTPAKPQTTHIAVPDTNRTRRSRGRP